MVSAPIGRGLGTLAGKFDEQRRRFENRCRRLMSADLGAGSWHTHGSGRRRARRRQSLESEAGEDAGRADVPWIGKNENARTVVQ